MTLENLIEIECEDCRKLITGNYGGGNELFAWAACNGCASILSAGALSQGSLTALLHCSEIPKAEVLHRIEENLKPCGKCAGAFKFNGFLPCPHCQKPFGDWVFAPMIAKKFKETAFNTELAWKKFQATCDEVRGESFYAKKTAEKSIELFKKREMQISHLEEIKTHYFFWSEKVFSLEESLLKLPNVSFLELIAKQIFPQNEADNLYHQYNAAFWLAKVVGKPFENEVGHQLTSKIFTSSNQIEKKLIASHSKMEAKVKEWQSWWLQKTGDGSQRDRLS